MNLLKLSLLLLNILLLNACSTTKNKIFWVSGMKTECSGGAGKMQCLIVHKGKNLDEAIWENFYSPIEGFEFEEGYMKKLEIREEKIANPPADGSSIRYTLIKELEKKVDFRVSLHGDWVLNRINDKPIDKSVKIPNMVINLSQMQVSGNGGCNNYNGQINKVTYNTIKFGNIVNTNRACLNMNIKSDYYNALNAVNTFQIEGDQLIFFNAKGVKVLSYLKGAKKEPNKNIHDIWVAVRINGNPISRMTPSPRLEINLTTMKIFGSDGCNEYSGELKEITDTQIIFGALASTKKMCSKMETAESFNKAMSHVALYRLEDLKLILLDANGKEILTLLKGD